MKLLRLAFVAGCLALPPAAPIAASDDVPSTQNEAAVKAFVQHVATHVVLHELAHALVREFDLPVLANEETLADAFATHYLVTHLPDRAPAVLKARVQSWMIEAGEVDRGDWDVSGEHNSDARRAHQVAALAIAADPQKYRFLGEMLGMSEADMRAAADYGTEIHRSWRRTLRPLWMPDDQSSREVAVRLDEDPAVQAMADSPLVTTMETAMRRFDWHSTVTFAIVQGDGGAGWNRSGRTITLQTALLDRFRRQGQRVMQGDDRLLESTQD